MLRFINARIHDLVVISKVVLWVSAAAVASRLALYAVMS